METERKKAIDNWIETHRKGNYSEIMALPKLKEFCLPEDKAYITKHWLPVLEELRQAEHKRQDEIDAQLDELKYEFAK